ncbi:MAG: ATP-binding protein [Bacteroidales bacterium]|jgi:signal transduction histidine kinase|nr:ATP-binding protein [Bacteroidales bacterium]
MQESNISILIAEDDVLSGKMMTITIKRLGYTFVGLATNTDDCIQMAEERRPDLILMDIDMPGKQDGIGAAQIITDRFGIPIIYVTANAEDSVFARALQTTPFGYILKPISKELIRTVVEMGYARHLVDLQLKEKQLELQKLNAVLEQKVEERTIELKNKNELLETALLREKEVNEFKSRIVTTISHEFRTPMTTIMSSAEIMERLIEKDQSKEKVFRHTNLVKKSVAELIELLNDVLLVEKFESGKYEVSLMPVDFDAYFKDLIFKMEIGIGKSHKFIHNIDKNFGVCKTDKKLLGHIFNNLLSNAFKYAEKDSTVNLNISKNKSNFTIEVIDQGLGMDKETLSMIFDSFYRAKNVTNIEGTGMGLSILNKSISMLEGEIKVESAPDKGSKFIVKLPLIT